MRLDQSGLPTFDRVCTNLNRLIRAGVEFNILCVVNKYVAQRARDVFENLAPYRYLQFIACLDDFDGHYSLTEQSYLHFLKTCFDLYFEAFQAGRPVSIRCFDNYLSILLGLPPESCAMFGECGQYLLIEADGSVYPCDFYVLDKWNLGNISEVSSIVLLIPKKNDALSKNHVLFRKHANIAAGIPYAATVANENAIRKLA